MCSLGVQHNSVSAPGGLKDSWVRVTPPVMGGGCVALAIVYDRLGGGQGPASLALLLISVSRGGTVHRKLFPRYGGVQRSPRHKARWRQTSPRHWHGRRELTVGRSREQPYRACANGASDGPPRALRKAPLSEDVGPTRAGGHTADNQREWTHPGATST